MPIKTGSSSTFVVVEWNPPEFYRYFDDVTLFLRIPNILGNLVSLPTDSDMMLDNTYLQYLHGFEM